MSPTPRSSRARALAVTAGVAAAYFGAARLGLSLAFAAEEVTVVWPPTGIAVAALVVFGRRAAVGVWIGALAANVTIGEPPAVAVAIASGNTLAALAARWLLRRTGFSRSLERIWDVMGLLGLAGLVASTASATVGVTALCLLGLYPWSAFARLWPLWWLGDAMGVVLVAPLLLTLTVRRPWPRAQTAEAVLLATVLSLVAFVVFAGGLASAQHGMQQLAYAVFPLVIWAAVRFRQRETAAAILAVAAVAVWGTARAHGPFVGRSIHESLILLQVFMGVVAGTGLVLGAAIAERRTAARRRAADYGVAQILAESSDVQSAAPRLLRVICHSLDWDAGAVWMVAEDGVLRCGEMWLEPGLSAPGFRQATLERSFTPGVGLPGRVWSTGRPAWIPDVVRDSNFPRARVAAAEGLHAAFGFPIRVGAEVVGVVEFFSREIRQPDDDLLQMFGSMGAQIGHFLERRRTEEERAHLLAELKRASQAKDEFLAVLGHELRNPLAPLRNSLEVLRARGWPDALAQRMGEVMDRQLRHMVRLVDDLLDVSRITRGRVELRKERVDLREVAGRAAEAVQPLLDERRHALSLTLPSEPLLVYADPARLEQVAANLLHNAARYTEAGGRIAVVAAREGSEAVLRVEDNGLGLRADMIERIFEPFVQGHREGRQPAEGLGIGLTLVRSLVEMHGGSVSAASAGPGQGSAFTVRLPVASEGAADAGVSAGEAAPTAAARPRRVLIVDDNVDGAESLAVVLRHEGHDVVAVYDERSAVEAAAARAFDVVLLDIALGDGADGYQVAERLRAHAAVPPVIVALTGFGQEDDHHRSRAAGFARHLVKPVDPRDLGRLLDSL